MIVSIENSEHSNWDEICDAWHLLKRDDLSVIRERLPAGGTEVMHSHHRARQFFYILEGQGTMVFEDRQLILHKGDGLEIAPQTRHQFKNRSNEDVYFLVISLPPTKGDRSNL